MEDLRSISTMSWVHSCGLLLTTMLWSVNRCPELCEYIPSVALSSVSCGPPSNQHSNACHSQPPCSNPSAARPSPYSIHNDQAVPASNPGYLVLRPWSYRRSQCPQCSISSQPAAPLSYQPCGPYAYMVNLTANSSIGAPAITQE